MKIGLHQKYDSIISYIFFFSTPISFKNVIRVWAGVASLYDKFIKEVAAWSAVSLIWREWPWRDDPATPGSGQWLPLPSLRKTSGAARIAATFFFIRDKAISCCNRTYGWPELLWRLFSFLMRSVTGFKSKAVDLPLTILGSQAVTSTSWCVAVVLGRYPLQPSPGAAMQIRCDVEASARSLAKTFPHGRHDFPMPLSTKERSSWRPIDPV